MSKEDTKMAVLDLYDINVKANEIYNEFIKETPTEEDKNADKSYILYEQMQMIAFNNKSCLNLPQ